MSTGYQGRNVWFSEDNVIRIEEFPDGGIRIFGYNRIAIGKLAPAEALKLAAAIITTVAGSIHADDAEVTE